MHCPFNIVTKTWCVAIKIETAPWRQVIETYMPPKLQQSMRNRSYSKMRRYQTFFIDPNSSIKQTEETLNPTVEQNYQKFVTEKSKKFQYANNDSNIKLTIKRFL